MITFTLLLIDIAIIIGIIGFFVTNYANNHVNAEDIEELSTSFWKRNFGSQKER